MEPDHVVGGVAEWVLKYWKLSATLATAVAASRGQIPVQQRPSLDDRRELPDPEALVGPPVQPSAESA